MQNYILTMIVSFTAGFGIAIITMGAKIAEKHRQKIRREYLAELVKSIKSSEDAKKPSQRHTTKRKYKNSNP